MAKDSRLSASIALLPAWFRRLSIGVAGGLIAGGALPRAGFWPLILLSVYLIHLAIRESSFRTGMLVGFFSGAAFYASQSIWMSAYLGPEPWLALAALEGIIFAIGLGISAFVWSAIRGQRSRLGNLYPLVTILALSAIWIAREWVACHWPYGGYQWSRLGQSLAPTPFASLAYFGGISLVSTFAIIVAVTLLVIPGSVYVAKAIGSIPVLALFAAAAVAPMLIHANTDAGMRKIQVTAIQGNANAGLFSNPVRGSILEKHIAATKSFVQQNQSTFAKPGFTVWPENASDVDPTTNPLASAAIHNIAAKVLRQPLIFGAVTNRNDKMFNSILVYKPRSTSVQIYDKRRPVPFGEYVPDRELWRPLAPELIDLIWRGFEPGKKAGILNVAGTKVGSLICFEIGIDELSHDLVTGGATIILSQANNADFGKTDEAFQQESLARLQAIATGRTVVHVSTVATTEIVNADGSLSAGPVKAFAAGGITAAISPSRSTTPAMRWFGWCDWLAIGSLAALLAWACVLRLRQRANRRSGNAQQAGLVS